MEIDLDLWRERKNRKPLILQGARQVGKSYLVEKVFAKKFENFIKLDFLEDAALSNLFSKSKKSKDIIANICLYFRKEIKREDYSKTLLFLDEIQESSEAMKSLKYFCEQVPELVVVAAGSYLGVLSNEASFPVGKVDFLHLNPLNFEEFLLATDPILAQAYKDLEIEEVVQGGVNKVVHEELVKAWALYQAIGGLPEVVQSFVENYASDKENSEGIDVALRKCREIQENLITGYKADFLKHSGVVNSSHILNVFEAVPNQLSKSYDESVKKFAFSHVIPKQKGFDRIKGPLSWLSKSRLVIQTSIATKADHPLKSYTKENVFKVYFFDIGLLNAMLDTPLEAIVLEDLGEYNGFIAENFVACELFSDIGKNLVSWEESNSDVEFLMIRGKDIIPLEVKSSKKSARAKSLDTFIHRYQPPVAYKLSPRNGGYSEKRKISSIPIYLARKLHQKVPGADAQS